MYNDNRFLKLRGQTVAVLRGRVLDVRRHTNGFLNTPPAIAIADDILNQLPEDTQIKVTNLDSRAVYYCSLAEFIAGAFKVDRGEPQHALPLAKWTQEIKQNSKAAGRGVMRTAKGNGHKTRNPKGPKPPKAPRQLFLKGLL